MDTRTDYAAADTAWVCARKKAYDQRLARKVALRINAREGHDVVVPYACTRCGQYHIGRRPAAELEGC